MLNIELLGGFRITRDGEPAGGSFTSRMQALVAYLALHAGVSVSRQQLAFVFWADSRESQARTNLRQLLHHLRSALPDLDSILNIDGPNVCWNNNSQWSLDTAVFTALAEHQDDYSALDQAARIYKGDLMPGVYEDWIEPHRARLVSLYESTLERLAALAATRGDIAGAISYAETLLSREPVREASYQLLMRLHGQKGDRAGALAVFERCKLTLRRELGVEPGHATNSVRDAILEGTTSSPVATTLPLPRQSVSSLVGRTEEWKSLLSAWEGACGGSPTFVSLNGEAGIGKTRLLEELRDFAQERGCSAVSAVCYSSGQALAYSAAADWLRSSAIRPLIGKLQAVERAQIARILPEILAEQPDIASPPPFTEGWQRRHFFDAIGRAVLLAKQPLLLSIDDLQWCDSETLEWLVYFLRSQPQARILVAATVRTEGVSRDRAAPSAARELGRMPGAFEIEVGPLSESDTQKLGEQVGGGAMGAHDAGALYSRTRGNPLFVCETVRAGGVGPDGLKARVHEVIGTRLNRLDGLARRLVEAAAVIGRPFTLDFAAKLAELSESDAIQCADELWRHRILRLDDAERYEFIHACVLDSAYAAIGPARKKQLHRLTAEALERIAAQEGTRGDENAAQIAAHYEQASEPRKAIPWYQRAAALVRRRYAEDEAIGLLNKALRLLEKQTASRERDETELEILLSLGPSLSALRGFAAEDSGRIYARARLLCEVLGETSRYITVLGGSWTYHAVRAELEIAREIASRYASFAERSGDSLLRAAGNFCLGSTEYFRGNLHESRDRLERSAELDRLSSTRHFAFGPELGVFSGAHLTHVLWLIGEANAAVAETMRNLDRARSLSHPFSSALALAYAAFLHQFLDEPEAAEDRAQAAASLCRKHGFKYYLSWTPIIIGWARARSGTRMEGLNEMLEGFEALRATGAGLRAPYYLGLIAQAAGLAGDPQKGLDYLRQARSLGERSRESWLRPELHRIEGDLLRQTGRVADAVNCYQTAVRTARQIGSSAWESRAQACLNNFSRNA